MVNCHGLHQRRCVGDVIARDDREYGNRSCHVVIASGFRLGVTGRGEA
jgi:hypothetical protein